MQPDPALPGSPAHWVQYAKAALALACIPLPEGVLHEMLCFHTQQAAEKSIKAVLILCGIEFPKTHDLKQLIDLLPDSTTRTSELYQVAKLTPYATISRYPRSDEAVTEDEYHEALELAETVLTWAEQLVRNKEHA